MNKHNVQIYSRFAAIFFLLCWLTCEGRILDSLVKNCTEPGLELCGENWCCCHTKPAGLWKARCMGHGRRLQFIPALPKYINEVYFEGNYLPNVSESTFTNISHLKVILLDLNNDNLSSITADAFSQLSSLGSLIVSNNEHLDVERFHAVLRRIPSVKRLDIENINLKSIDNIFHGLLFQNMKTLNIGQNSLRTLNTNMFNYFPNLERLAAGNCSLKEFKTVLNPKKLQDLDLRNNFLSPDLPDFCHNSKLNNTFFSSSIVYLKLQNNYIQRIKAHRVICLKHLRELNLFGNQISVIEANLIPHFSNIQCVHLDGMKIRLRKIEKGAFNNSKLERLLLAGNRYEFKNDGIFDGLVGLKKLDISRNRMFGINESRLIQLFKPLENIELLNIAQVHLPNLRNEFLRLFPKLKVLYAENNHIRSLHGSFQSIQTIKTIYLRQNLITEIKKEDFPVPFLSTLESVDLSSNPFGCTCELQWFRKWTNEVTGRKRVSLVNWPKLYKCYSPPRLHGRQLSDYNPTDKSCASSDSMTTVLVFIAISSILLLMILISLVLYRQRWYLRYWIYKLQRMKAQTDEQTHLLEDSDILYDGYVIYNDDDSDFVHRDMIDEIEKRHHQKLFIWNRDAQTRPTIETMYDAICSSRNVLALISSNSLKDNYFKFQLEVAVDRMVQLNRKFILLILLKDIDFGDLNYFWCNMLTKLPTAVWCQESGSIKREIFEQHMNDFFNLNHGS